MKAKRILAMVLSVAVVASSGNFTLDVSAMDNLTDLPVVIAEEDGTVSGDITSGSTVSGGEIFDGSEEPAFEGSVSGNDSEEVSSGDAGNVDETVSPGDAGNSDETVSSGDVGNPDDTVSSGDAQQSELPDAETTGGEIIDVDSLYFAMYEDGTLTLKQGVELSSLKGTLKLPAEVKKIPVGIFNANTSITGLTISSESQLTTIEAGAFEGAGVTSLTIPAAVTEIADETFKDSKLTTITFSDESVLVSIGKEAFADSSLTKIIIPDSVTTIGASAFKDCSSLTYVDMGEVQSIGKSAFKGCTVLKTNIKWSGSLKAIGDGAFENSGIQKLDLSGSAGAGITTWGTAVFAGCSNLTTVSLHKDMKVIPYAMFRNCNNLSSVTIPANCTRIEREAFYGCKIQSITIPEKVGIIESNAYGGCQSLTTIIIKQCSSDGSGVSDIVLAEDAFPRKSSVLMKGYDGTVEDYADKRGYNFESLVPPNTITKSINFTSRGTVELSKSSAKKGETVNVTVTPAENCFLKAGTFYFYVDDDDSRRTYITKLEEDKETSQVFSFVMPNDKVTVHVDFVQGAPQYGTLSVYDFETNNEMLVEWDGKTATFDQVGYSARLIIASDNSLEKAPGCWQFNYSSSAQNVAIIDSEGVIYARGEGTTTITAQLKNSNQSVKFTLRVAKAKKIDNVTLEFSDWDKARILQETIDDETMTVIQYTKESLSKRSREFQVNLKATSGSDSTNLFVASTWKSANTNLAYPGTATVWDNTNTIHVKSGVSGETAITVTATNGYTDKNKEVYGEEQTFIVRVVDATPRLEQSTLTVNSLCTAGTEFDLTSVYGYEVDPLSLHIVEDVKSSNIKEYKEFDGLDIVYRDFKHYLVVTEEGRDALKNGKDISYANKLYIEGEYVYHTEAGDVRDTFRTPIKSLVLTSKALKPTVKTSGKLNLFFNSGADVTERGEVILTQSLKDLNVESYELVSEANYKTPGSQTLDPFANNFVVSREGVISRSDRELMTDAKGKVITSGYLKIKYEGYDYCYVKLTVPVQNIKPSYVLSMTKATVHENSKNYVLPLQILDKKTKKPISLKDLENLSFDDSAAGLTTNLFYELDKDEAKNTDTISLKIKNVQKAKAIIIVEMDTWNEPLKFTFDLSVVSKLPTVKTKSTTLTLNNLCVGREASTVFTVSQTDVNLSDMRMAGFVGSKSLQEDAQHIHFDFDDETDSLTVYADQKVKTGSYKFSFVPELTYVNELSESAKAVTVTVKVVENKLTMSMKNSTLTLNRLFAGNEEASTTYTIKNLPVGENVEIDDSKVEITGTNNASIDVLKSNFVQIAFNPDGQTIEAELLDDRIKAATYKFKVTGLKTIVEGEGVEIQPFTVSVKVINTNPKVTLKSSGTLNPCNPSSQITYKFTVSNVNARIDDTNQVKVYELNTLGATQDLASFDVEYVRDEKDYITGVMIKAKDTVTLDAKKTYKIKIGIQLKGAELPIVSSALTVKPKQVMPKIKTDVTSVNVRAGVDADNPRRSQEVLITKTSEKDAVIAGVVLADSNSDNLKKAFKVSFDEKTQKVTIKLVRPYLIKPNTQYNLKLEVKTQGQMDNTTGPTFTTKVQVLP